MKFKSPTLVHGSVALCCLSCLSVHVTSFAILDSLMFDVAIRITAFSNLFCIPIVRHGISEVSEGLACVAS